MGLLKSSFFSMLSSSPSSVCPQAAADRPHESGGGGLWTDGGTNLDVPRGTCRPARIIAPHTCIRWVDETRTMMQ